MKRPSNRIATLAAASLLATVGIGTGIGVAASGSDTSPAAGLAEALNKNEGTQLTEADVQAAMQDAYKARLDAAVAAGRLTQAEADEQLQRAKDAPQRRAEHEARRAAVLAPVEKLLGMTADQIQEKRQDGTTLAELATEKGIDREKLLAAITEGLKAAGPKTGTTAPTDAELTTQAERIADGEGRGGRGHGGDGPGPGGFGFGG